MKKVLLYLLLLANFCSGLAFAWDTHPEAMAGHDMIVFDAVDNDSYHRSGNEPHHDNHSCHGAAHLVGVFYSAASLIATSSRGEYAIPAATIPFRYLDPRLRPPIV